MVNPLVPSHLQIFFSDFLNGDNDVLWTAVISEEYSFQTIVAASMGSNALENSVDNEKDCSNHGNVVKEGAGCIDEKFATIAHVKEIVEIKGVRRELLWVLLQFL